MGRIFSGVIALSAIILLFTNCIPFATAATTSDNLEDQRKLLEAEKKVVEARAALEEAKVKEQFAQEKALKDLFGSSPGKEGTVSIGEAKPFLRVQPAGAAAVKGLADRFCAQLKPVQEANRAYILTEVQLKTQAEALAYMDSLEQLQSELVSKLKEAGYRPPEVTAKILPAIVLAPVAANAIVSVLKLFRSDLAVGFSDNPNFALLFVDFLATLKECQETFSFPEQKTVKKDTLVKANELQHKRAEALDHVVKAEAFLKEHEKEEKALDPKIVAVRTSANVLKDAANVLSPTIKESKLTDYAAALSLAKIMDKSPRLTYKLDTQQVQLFKTGIFLGTRLKRSGSAQVFFRMLSSEGQLLGAGYLSYSTPQVNVKIEEQECYQLNTLGTTSNACP